MKSLKMGLLGLVVSGFAFAGQVPDCFNSSGVIEGSYTIQIETQKISKENLIRALELAGGRYLQTSSYPLVFSSQHAMFVYTHAAQNVLDKLPKNQFIRAVEAELQPIADMDGVSIVCQVPVYPAAN